MTAFRKLTLLYLVVLCCLFVFGCSKDDEGIPTTTPDNTAAKVDADAAKMDVTQLRAAALKCRAEMEAKTAESEKIAQELIKALASDKLGENEALKKKSAELSKATEVLVKQYEGYIAQIKAKGGDLSGLEITE
jgi:hypothetical protein